MNVLHVVGEYPKVSETFIRDFIKATSRQPGIDCTVLALKGRLSDVEECSVIGIKRPFSSRILLAIFCILKNFLFFLKSAKCGLRGATENAISRECLSKLNKSYTPDLVIVHFATLYKPVFRLAESSTIGAKVFFRGFELNTKTGLSMEDLKELSNASKLDICAVSTGIATELVKKMPSLRVKVVRSGLDISRYDFSRKSIDSKVIFVQVGRLVPKKGGSVSLEWLHHLSVMRPNIDWEFRVVGNGPEYDRLLKKASRLGLSNRVVFMGALPNQKTLIEISNAHVLLSPNIVGEDGDIEGVPNVIKEAMLLGTPVVSSTFFGNLELVEHNKTGFVNDTNDLNGFIRILDRILLDRDVDHILCAARDRVIQEYSVDKICKSVLNCAVDN
jgi:glycosyltransferase involved in cell wall biosynthesis